MTGMGYGVAGQMSQIPPGGMDFSSPAAAGAGMAAGGLGAASDLQTQQFSIPKGVSGRRDGGCEGLGTNSDLQSPDSSSPYSRVQAALGCGRGGALMKGKMQRRKF